MARPDQTAELHTHVLAGDPVRDIVKLAAGLLVIGATGHSDFYEPMLGSRQTAWSTWLPVPCSSSGNPRCRAG